jgi:hypothetical protein
VSNGTTKGIRALNWPWKLQPQGHVDRERARACLIANAALPGSGSLMAGQAMGYVQLVLGLLGLLLTLVHAVPFLIWFLSSWAELQNPETDPQAILIELWRQVRWSLLGMVLFGVAWLWSVLAGLFLVSRSRSAAASSGPPRLRGS